MKDLFKLSHPPIKERAASAFKKVADDRRCAWEDELDDLWQDTINFFRKELLSSEEEIYHFQNNAKVSEYDPNRPGTRVIIYWEYDGIKFKINYIIEETDSVQTYDSREKIKLYDKFLYVMVNTKGSSWRKIESLGDLGEILA